MNLAKKLQRQVLMELKNSGKIRKDFYNRGGSKHVWYRLLRSPEKLSIQQFEDVLNWLNLKMEVTWVSKSSFLQCASKQLPKDVSMQEQPTILSPGFKSL